MKARTLAISAVVVLFVAGSAPAQSNPGFPPLPPVPHTGHLKEHTSKTKFTFIVAGDNRPQGKTPTQPKILSQLLNDAQRFNPDFFLWCGDTISGHITDGATLQQQYDAFFKVAKQAKKPIFNAPGNHEMDTVDKVGSQTIETPNAQMQAFYLQFMGFPVNAPPYGAFNYGNSRFIAMDTEELAPVDAVRSPGRVVASGTKLDPGFVSDEQIRLLTNDLEANKDKAHIFVFMHHPIKPNKTASGLNQENAKRLEELFKSYNKVSYVLAAHEHLYFNASGKKKTPPPRQDPSTKDPVYLVTGGAGAPLDKCGKSPHHYCGKFYHYLVFNVDDDMVTVQVVQLPNAPKKAKTKK